jgi:hypothetical protein
MMDKLSQDVPVALAVSLHASNDELRNGLMPLNKKYPLKELMAACKRYSSLRRATSSPSNTACSTASTTPTSTRANWWRWCSTPSSA